MSLLPFSAVLEHSAMLTDAVKTFTWRIEKDSTFQYQPGQFITLHLEHQGKLLKRSYSIANFPQENNTIEFAASFVPDGPASQLLFALKPGATLSMTGPFGRLLLPTDFAPVQRFILIGTGTGVTPYRSMLPLLHRFLMQEPKLSVHFLQGTRLQQEGLYVDEFLQFCEEHPQQARFSLCLSREPRENTYAQHIHLGYVQSLLAQLTLHPNQDRVYLCGNPGMIDDCFQYLNQQNFESKAIIREKYISSGSTALK
ncbi:MAG: FAD-binding oxidoreductase [Legionellaceae bacterium]|nr:FAD-binding oxidoreductase [Legionellaceae bacterium]